MADDESSSTSDESLDVKSVKFDPLKALYSTKIKLSSTKAPIYDNVSKFEAVMSGLSKQSKKNDRTTDAKQGECSRQRFLSHQESVANKKKIEKRDWIADGRNVLSKMQRTFGPLGMLHEYMENRTRVKILLDQQGYGWKESRGLLESILNDRAHMDGGPPLLSMAFRSRTGHVHGVNDEQQKERKVYTRNARGIRGHVEAYVAAFDKHWNLALEDCFEIWTRKVKRKAPALGIPSGVKTIDDETAPKVIVKKIEGKMETLERHVPQMLLRGEQVAIIVKIN